MRADGGFVPALGRDGYQARRVDPEAPEGATTIGSSSSGTHHPSHCTPWCRVRRFPTCMTLTRSPTGCAATLLPGGRWWWWNGPGNGSMKPRRSGALPGLGPTALAVNRVAAPATETSGPRQGSHGMPIGRSGRRRRTCTLGGRSWNTWMSGSSGWWARGSYFFSELDGIAEQDEQPRSTRLRYSLVHLVRRRRTLVAHAR